MKDVDMDTGMAMFSMHFVASVINIIKPNLNFYLDS